MKIYDLTRGKYSDVYSPILADGYNKKIRETYISYFSYFARLFGKSDKGIVAALDHASVFLVESSMGGEYVPVPGERVAVCVPASTYMVEDFRNNDIWKWLNSKEEAIGKPYEPCTLSIEVHDRLGVYIQNTDKTIAPIRIYIWMDRIVDSAKERTAKSADFSDNTKALFDLVFYHEMAHALMDINLYGVEHAPNFSYATDYVYRFFEEAYANAIAEEILMDGLPANQVSFILDFIKDQPDGYSYGARCTMSDAIQWMSYKVLFNYDCALLLRDTLEGSSHFTDFSVVESIGYKGWLAVKNRHHKWNVVDVSTRQRVEGFKEYDYFWSFSDDGLCQVRLDTPDGFRYGFVNKQGEEQIPVAYDHLYSFENDITVAKKDGMYGIIDINNKVLVPFGLLYKDIRGFRNGRAAVQDYTGKWGVINTKGELIVPCESEKIVL